MVTCPGSLVHTRQEEFRHQGKYSDVRINVRGRTFECHRFILAAASEYFDKMFRGNFKESYGKEVQLYDPIDDPEVFEEVLQAIYSGKQNITEDNAFNLLVISEFLSIQTIRDPCIEFILEKKDSVNKVIEIFVWARQMNILPLIDPLLKQISNDFVRLSENIAFLEMPFEDLYAVFARRSTQSSLFEVDDLLVDALVRWLHYSYANGKNHFETLGAMIASAKISIEYSNFLTMKYELDPKILVEQNTSKNESFFKTYVACSDKYSCDHDNLFSTSFADYQFLTDHSSIHLYLREKILTINKIYNPNGFISHVNKCKFIESNEKESLISSGESDHVYCFKYLNRSMPTEVSFCAYSSIDLLESNSQNLRPPPVFLGPQGVLDEKCKRIYFNAWNGFQNAFQRYKNTLLCSTYYKAFTDEELKTGVFYYNCERDEWFTLPRMKLEKMKGQVVVDRNLIYFISSLGYVQAYDIRTSQLLKMPDTKNRYNIRYSCCVLDGKIYVASKMGVEVFHPSIQRWEILRSIKNPSLWRSYTVPYDNMLWVFHKTRKEYEWDDYHSELSLQVYNPNSQEWKDPSCSSIGENIFAKFDFKEKETLFDVLNYVIVSNAK